MKKEREGDECNFFWGREGRFLVGWKKRTWQTGGRSPIALPTSSDDDVEVHVMGLNGVSYCIDLTAKV